MCHYEECDMSFCKKKNWWDTVVHLGNITITIYGHNEQTSYLKFQAVNCSDAQKSLQQVTWQKILLCIISKIRLQTFQKVLGCETYWWVPLSCKTFGTDTGTYFSQRSRCWLSEYSSSEFWLRLFIVGHTKLMAGFQGEDIDGWTLDSVQNF